MHQSGNEKYPPHRPTSPEQAPLADDLCFFREQAEFAPDPGIRHCAGRLASCIEFFQRPESPFPKIFEQYGFDEAVHNLTNAEIARYLALNRSADDSALRKLLRPTFLPWALLEALQNEGTGWDGRDFETVLTFLCVVFRSAMRKEYLSRRTENEDANGRAVRNILVEESKRGELVMELGEQITEGLFFPGEVRWRSEEVPAEAYVGLWERVSEYTKCDPVASDPDCLRRFMEGALNGIPGAVVGHIRTRIQTENRRLKIQVDAEHAPNDDDLQCPSPGSRRVLSEMRINRAEAENFKILVEQFRSGLNAKDKKIFELCLIERHTQEEASALLGLGQSAISKRLSRIRTAWTEVGGGPHLT